MEYCIISSNSQNGLERIVVNYIKDGWTPEGGHQVVVLGVQNRYAGTQFMSSESRLSYSQSMIKK